MARVWQDVPKISWSRVTETPPGKESEESKVAANTPSARSDAEDALSSERASGRLRMSSRAAERRKSKDAPDSRIVAQSSRNSGPRDPFLDDAGTSESSLPAAVDAVEPQIVSARERLRAALSDDSRRSPAEDTDDVASEQERLRLRIESLMARARAYLDEEQLISAKRTVELARNLAETSNLEFAPDEERPVDLLARIQGKLAAEAAEAALAEAVAAAETTPVERPSAQGAESAANEPRRRRVRHPFESSVPFDPYAPRVALARHRDTDEPLFGTSLVVLESPSFEEAAAKRESPAFVRRSHRDRANDSAAPSREAYDSEEEVVQLLLPQEEQATTLETEPPTDLDLADAPAPPISEPREPKLARASAVELPAQLDLDGSDDDVEDEVRTASVWPRWMPLSLLSLLVAAFCAWLWRRRSQTELGGR
jgi:hypothetical protein